MATETYTIIAETADRPTDDDDDDDDKTRGSISKSSSSHSTHYEAAKLPGTEGTEADGGARMAGIVNYSKPRGVCALGGRKRKTNTTNPIEPRSDDEVLVDGVFIVSQLVG